MSQEASNRMSAEASTTVPRHSFCMLMSLNDTDFHLLTAFVHLWKTLDGSQAVANSFHSQRPQPHLNSSAQDLDSLLHPTEIYIETENGSEKTKE